MRLIILHFTAIMILVPANVFPVMTVTKLGQGEPSTILGGVIKLIDDGMLVLAMIILFASIVVPVLKIIILSFLLITVKKDQTGVPEIEQCFTVLLNL